MHYKKTILAILLVSAAVTAGLMADVQVKHKHTLLYKQGDFLTWKISMNRSSDGFKDALENNTMNAECKVVIYRERYEKKQLVARVIKSHAAYYVNGKEDKAKSLEFAKKLKSIKIIFPVDASGMVGAGEIETRNKPQDEYARMLIRCLLPSLPSKGIEIGGTWTLHEVKKNMPAKQGKGVPTHKFEQARRQLEVIAKQIKGVPPTVKAEQAPRQLEDPKKQVNEISTGLVIDRGTYVGRVNVPMKRHEVMKLAYHAANQAESIGLLVYYDQTTNALIQSSSVHCTPERDKARNKFTVWTKSTLTMSTNNKR